MTTITMVIASARVKALRDGVPNHRSGSNATAYFSPGGKVFLEFLEGGLGCARIDIKGVALDNCITPMPLRNAQVSRLAL